MFYLVIALTSIALGLSVYLTILSWAGNAVAGCGADSGCGQVLASKWSKVGPVPVALLGALTQLAVLVGLGLRIGSAREKKISDALLWCAAPALILAALWFSYVQVVELGALCPYCMADHVIGFTVALLLLATLLRKPAINPAPAAAIGIVGVLAMIITQTLWTPANAPQRAPNPFADQDGDAWIDDARYVSLFGGELQFVLQDVPYIGEPDAKQVVAVLFDYACPYCQTLHELLDEAIADDPTRFVLVPIPLTIDASHNPFVGSDNPRFDDSFERALLSMAVGAVDREKWKRFDKWLFNADGSGVFPRSAADAKSKAEELVGPDALNAQLTGDNLAKHEANLKRNITLLGLLPVDKRFIPVTTTPGAPDYLTARYDDIEVLYELLDSAALPEK